MAETTKALDDDREEWNRVWGSQTLRAVPGEISPLWSSSFFNPAMGRLLGIVVAPEQFADRIWAETDTCLVCGKSTLNEARVKADIQTQYGMLGVWLHRECLDRCPDTKVPAGIPW